MAKISVNQLAKFLTSNSAQHRTIIQGLINPSAFRVNYYEKAQNGISDFLLAPTANDDIIVNTIKGLNSIVPQSDYDESRRDNNIDALDSFLMVLENIQFFDGGGRIAATKPCPKVVIDEVEISVFPECVFTGTSTKGVNIVGAVKLYFSREEHLSDEMGAYIGAITKQFLTEQYPQCTVRDEYCQVIDVFNRSIYHAPKAFKRRLDAIKAACSEIKFWWNSLSNNQN